MSRLTQRTHHDDWPDLEPRSVDTKSNASTIRPPSFPRIPSPIITNVIPIICCNLHRGPRGFCVIKDDCFSLQFYFTKKYIIFNITKYKFYALSLWLNLSQNFSKFRSYNIIS